MPVLAPTNETSVLIESAWQLREQDPEKSYSMIRGLYDCAESDALIRAQLYVVEANYRWRKYQFKRMMKVLVLAFEILDSHHNDLWLARLHGRIALGLSCLGEVANVYKHLYLQYRAAQLCESGVLQDAELFNAHHNMGRHFFIKGDFRRADRCYRRSYSHLSRSDPAFVLLLQNHADTHVALGQFRVASMEIERALELGSCGPGQRAIVYALGVKARIFKEQGELDEAINMLVKAKAYALEHGFPTVQQRMRLASLYLLKNKADLADIELKPVEGLLPIEGDKHDRAEFEQRKSELYAAIGQYKKALTHFKCFHQLRIEIFSSERDVKAQSESLITRLGQLRRESVKLRQSNLALKQSVAQLESRNKEAIELSERDSLTALYNRRMLNKLADGVLETARHAQSSTALCVVDIDHFKAINDRFGHAAGDEALRTFAAFLQNSFRAADCIARYGGEEFVVLLPEADLDTAEKATSRLREAVDSYRWCDRVEGLEALTFSAGVSVTSGLKGFKQLFMEADKAMYEAKSAGRNCTRRYAESELV